MLRYLLTGLAGAALMAGAAILISRAGKGVRANPVLAQQSQGGGGGGSFSLSEKATTTNSSGSTQTNQLAIFTLATSPTEVGASEYVRVYDDDGSGGKGSLIDSQQDLVSSVGGIPRFRKIVAVVPSIAGSATRKLHLENSASKPSGDLSLSTAITASNLLATSFNVKVTLTTASGTSTVQATDLLAATTTFTDFDTDCLHGKFREGGLCTEFHVSGKLGSYLRVFMDISAYKLSPGAVSGGNPIVFVECDVSIENGHADASFTNLDVNGSIKVERSTSLSDATLISTNDTDMLTGATVSYSFQRSQPAVTITLSGTTEGSTITITRTGSWDADVLGCRIVNAGGAGKATVISRDSNTQITCYVYEAFSASSYTSGNWTQEAYGHWAGGKFLWPVYVGTKPLIKTIAGNHTSAISPTTNAWMVRMAASNLMRNCTYAYGSVDHSTGIGYLDANKVSGIWRPFTTTAAYSNGFAGEMLTNVGNTGDRIEIGLAPAWAYDFFIKPTTDGWRRLLENAIHWSGWEFTGYRLYNTTPTNGSRGVDPRLDNGVQYTIDTRFGDSLIDTPKNSATNKTAAPFNGDIAHHCNPLYYAYLATGKRFYLSALQQQVTYLFMTAVNPGLNGYGMANTVFGPKPFDATLFVPIGDRQFRSVAWSLRDLLLAATITPDASNNQIYNPQSVFRTALTNQWDEAAQVKTNLAGTAVDDWYADTLQTGWVWFGLNNNYTSASTWQTDYLATVLAATKEIGLNDSNFDTVAPWVVEGRIGHYSSSDVPPDYMTSAYFPVTSYTRAKVTGSITLSATSGSSVTLTVGGGLEPFADTLRWRVGGYVTEADGILIGINRAKITAIPNTHTLTIDTTATLCGSMSSTSLSTIYSSYIPAKTYAEQWKANVQHSPMVFGNTLTYFFTAPYRFPDAITLSATGGSSVTVTVSMADNAEPFANGGSWYAGAWVMKFNDSDLTVCDGAGVITSVVNGHTVVIDTTVPDGMSFPSTTPNVSRCRIPGPHPSDAGTAGTLTGRDSHYMAMFRLTAVTGVDWGRTNSAAAKSYIEASTGFPTLTSRFKIDPR